MAKLVRIATIAFCISQTALALADPQVLVASDAGVQLTDQDKAELASVVAD